MVAKSMGINIIGTRHWLDKLWDFRYCEEDFLFCLLACGNVFIHDDYDKKYWESVDKWFQKNYPKRYSSDQLARVSCDNVHQMSFKRQFYVWSRDNDTLNKEKGGMK